ncbi:MAG: hypothetical protein AAB466_10845 [Verrucomicrobiota bacterium]
MTKKSNEADSLALITELQALLAKALDSIAGKTTEAEVSYLIWGASHVNKVVAGYSELRSRHLIHASKIMIRPVIEATAAVVAAIKQPGFRFQKACSEYRDDKNLLVEFRKVLEASKQPTGPVQQQLAALEKDWGQFKQNWNGLHPAGPKIAKKLLFPDVLHAAGLDAWYAQYRIYCQFTHGALRATSGDLDEMTDSADNLVIARLTLIILDQLRKHAPVEVPDLGPLWQRADCLMEQTKWT